MKLVIIGMKNHKKKKKKTTTDNNGINDDYSEKRASERARGRRGKKQKNGKKSTHSANFKIKAFGSHIESNVCEKKFRE